MSSSDHANGAGEHKEQIIVKDRVCDYYISARGCVKGDSCDFLHPLAPSGAQTNRVCDFYSSARGCVKGDKCDFLHPRRLNPRGEQTTRVCDFFLTPQGCIKGNNCDFIHARVPPAHHFSNTNRGPSRGASNNSGAAGGGRVCEYYLTPAGCNKGNNCNFLHPTGRAAQEALANVRGGANKSSSSGSASSGNSTNTKKTQPCDFYFSASGCKKGDACPFSHEQRRGGGGSSSSSTRSSSSSSSGSAATGAARKPRICGFYNTERGCVKGDACEFIHIKDKNCDFWLSENGCKKGDWCGFKHPIDSEGNPAADGIDNRITQAAQKAQTQQQSSDTNNTQHAGQDNY